MTTRFSPLALLVGARLASPRSFNARPHGERRGKPRPHKTNDDVASISSETA